MFVSSTGLRSRIGGALSSLIAVTASSVLYAAPVEKPVAGQQVRFPNGYWSALPQVGADGKVRQCVLVALRQRAGNDGPVDTPSTLACLCGRAFTPARLNSWAGTSAASQSTLPRG
jgi:hypothetical protein